MTRFSQAICRRKPPWLIALKTWAIAMVAAIALGSMPAVGQETGAGSTGRSAIGQVGQRQTRDQTVAGIEPLARINNRIQNRVQSRQRNRIDRFYDPRANAISPFEVAGDQARNAANTGRR